MDIQFYFSLFLRRLPYFLIMLFLGSAIGITLARVLPPVYLARATLLVESEQIPGEMAASTVETQATEQLQIIQQRILTRATLIEMANRLGVYATGDGKPAPPQDADELVEDMRRRVGIVTTGGPVARGPEQATLVSVSFEAPTAALAASVANEVVTLILKEDVGMRTGVARQTLDFFEQEVARLDQELITLGAEILQFKEKSLDALPDSLEFRRSQQAAAQERLLQLDREQTELRDRRDRLVRLHDSLGAVGDATPIAQQTPEERQLQSMRDEMSAQLALLSPENPKIKLMQAQIAALEKVVAEQTSGGAVDEAGRQLSVYEIQLADLDGQLAFIEDQKTQIGAEMEALRASIEATPGNAIALDTLERDYTNVRVQYDQAVANKARAETGDTIEALSKGQRISVIEQAVAPREPESPNRSLVAAAGVSGGFALGLGLIVLLELMNSGIRRPIELTNRLGIAPIAVLPYLRTRREILRRRLIIMLALLVVLAGIPAALWAVQTYVMPLDQLLERLLQSVGIAG